MQRKEFILSTVTCGIALHPFVITITITITITESNN